MHGYNHVYTMEDSGIFPVNNRSGFARALYEVQRQKIRAGKEIIKKHNIHANVFYGIGAFV